MNSRELLKQLYIGIGITVVAFAAIGAIFMRPIWIYELALVVGGGAACFLLYHTYDSLDRALDMQAKSARGFVTLRVLFRLFLRAGILVAGILIHWSAFVGAAIGLMSIKISAYINPLIKKHRIKAGIIPPDPPATALPVEETPADNDYEDEIEREIERDF